MEQNNKPLVSWKPNKADFIYLSWLVKSLKGFIITLIGVLILLLFLPFFLILGVLLIFLLITIFWLVNNFVSYSKEEYHLYADRLVKFSGSIFSDYQTELIIKNITYMHTTIPFPQNYLLGTANIDIQSAGSDKSEISLKSINNYPVIEQKIIAVMKDNGFSLQKKQLQQMEHPSSMGIVISLLGGIVQNLSVLIFGLGTFFMSFYTTEGTAVLMWFLIFISFILLIIGILRLLFLFLDLRKRTYQVFADTIVYTEGFLTRHHSFIPLENLADSTIEQSLIFRLLGIYNLKLSCQGSGKEIIFEYMRNGREMEKIIDGLIIAQKELVKTGDPSLQKNTSIPLSIPKDTSQIESTLPLNVTKQNIKTDFTGEYSMNILRSLVMPLLSIPITLIVLFINPLVGLVMAFGLITLIMAIFFTTYHINEDNIQEKYKFLNVKEKKFTNDKITGIVVSENIIDGLFNTQSIKFWSIGSDTSIQFKNIEKQPHLISEILKKLGIVNQPQIYNIPAKFSLKKYLIGNIFFPIKALLFMALGLISFPFVSKSLFIMIILGQVLFLLISFSLSYVISIFRYAQAQIQVFPNYIIATKGFFFKQITYTLFDSVKDIETVKYPFAKFGDIKFNIAGEELAQNKNQNKLTLVSNDFQMEYVENISDLDEMVDLVLHYQPKNKLDMQKIIDSFSVIKTKKHILLQTHPALINSLIVFILIPPLWLFIPIVVWSLSVTSYQIETFRVIKSWGIIYKFQKSLILKKIDFIDKKQGFLNKIFGNGTLSINTVGSSETELEIANVSDYQLFYEIIKKRYK